MGWGRVNRDVWLGRLQTLVALLGLGVGLDVHASFRFDHLTVVDGLLQSRATAIAEDSNGEIWIGTEAGINIYDGYELREFVPAPPNASLLSGQRIAALSGQWPGEMWVATRSGVFRVDLSTQAIEGVVHTDLYPNDPSRKSDPNAQFIKACSDGMWVLRSRSVYYLSLSSEGIASQRLLTTVLPPEFELSYSGFSGVVDAQGQVWIADHSRLWRADCQNPTPTLITQREAKVHAPVPGGSALALSSEGMLFWASRAHIDVLDTQEAKIIDHTAWINENLGTLYGIARDPQGAIWIDAQHALGRVSWVEGDPMAGSFERFYVPDQSEVDAAPLAVVDTPGFRVSASGDGLYWMYGAHGLMAIEPQSGAVTPIVHDPTRPYSFPPIRDHLAMTMYTDRFGVIWLSAGLNGVSRYAPERNRFSVINNEDPSFQSARRLAIVSLDDGLYLWVSWDGAKLNLWKLQPDNDFSLVTDFELSVDQALILGQETIRAMVSTGEGMVWMASSSKLWRANTQTGEITLAHTFDAYAGQGDGVIYADVSLDFDPEHNRMVFIHQLDVWQIELSQPDEIRSIERLKHFGNPLDGVAQTGVLWLGSNQWVIGTDQGLRWLDLENNQSRLYSLSNNDDAGVRPGPQNGVVSMALGPADGLWVGTRQGLRRFQWRRDERRLEATDAWTHHPELPQTVIYAIAPQSASVVWVSTNRGLIKIEWPSLAQAPPEMTQFGAIDGLPTVEFNSKAFAQDNTGRWYFGSINGVAWFRPDEIQLNTRPPDVMVREVWINDQPIEGVRTDQRLELTHQRNNLTIAYSGLHFTASGQNRYAYQLEGHDNQWVSAGSGRIARYANLSPGNYRFWVRSANLDGVWSEPKLLLQATIAPPPWATPWAYGLYALLLLTIIASVVISAIRRGQRLEALVAQRTLELAEKNDLIASQAQALRESLDARTLFFANISHEFRTPLTLIGAALEELEPSESSTKAKALADRYLRRLARLVDQLLDLSKLRLRGVSLAKEPWSVNTITNITTEAFKYPAERRGIALAFHADHEYQTQVDQLSVEKILLNLLSNAMKYTPAGGHVWVSLSDEAGLIQLSVKDTGPGISPHQQTLIFDRFERVASEETLKQEGAGIGLALVKEAALAIGGSIELNSTLGQGSEFVVSFPGECVDESKASLSSVKYLSEHRLALDAALVDQLAHSEADEGSPAPVDQRVPSQSKPVILIVEDNADLRNYLSDLLRDDWQCIQAEDGEQALIYLRQHEVDIILADVMMPNMDGFALLSAVRDELATSHIPFLLLTARHDTESRMSGLTLSADDYLTKPFDANELKVKLANMVQSKARLRAHLVQDLGQGSLIGALEGDAQTLPGIDSAELSPRDHKFVERLRQWLAEHHTHAEMTVTHVADQLSVNERTLQRKIRALAGMTPMQYLTAYRLRQSLDALLNPRLTIQEVAFEVGFSSQQTFSRAFKQAYGETPSDWRQKHISTR